MQINFTPYSYEVLLTALKSYYATLEEGHPHQAKTAQLIEQVRNLVKVNTHD